MSIEIEIDIDINTYIRSDRAVQLMSEKPLTGAVWHDGVAHFLEFPRRAHSVTGI